MPPENANDLHQLAIRELDNGNLSAALKHARQAVDLEPANIPCRETLGRILYRIGDLPAVIAIHESIVKEQPGNLPALRRLTRLLMEGWQFERADTIVAQALALDGLDAQLLSMRIFIKHELGSSGEARDLAIAAARLHPNVLSLALDAHLLLPMVYPDATAVATCRQRYADGLDALSAEIPKWQKSADQVFNVERSNFLLAYQGGDDRELQQGYAGLIGQLVRTAAPELNQRLPLRFDGQRKLRIGFVSKWFYASTAGNYFERWITQLDSGRFERYVYYTGQGEDELTRRIESGCEYFTRLLKAPRENGNRILSDQLDVLVYPEVGMSTGSYLLSAMRLAPVQFAAWGHPVTTGSTAIDYYLSCGSMEPEGYAAHYSEQVILLDGIGVDIALPPEERPIERSALGLPNDAHLYFCPQSLFKIHPDMDDVFVKILQGDSRGVLVFFQAGSRSITMAFANRLAGRLAAAGISAKGQFKFLPRLSGGMFRRALGLADVMLDTLHWSGGGTSLDAFAANVPVVSLPGPFMRGRQTAAMLRLMGLQQLVAADVDDYVAKAIELAANRELNASIRDKIALEKRNVFGRAEANAEFSEKIHSTVIAHANQ
ncbi:MAG: hypothetical protein IPP88_19235 [Betaproteobacteria bacterium]|nr:hypothetical protein [Betaproteobacteria bacterium]